MCSTVTHVLVDEYRLHLGTGKERKRLSPTLSFLFLAIINLSGLQCEQVTIRQ